MLQQCISVCVCSCICVFIYICMFMYIYVPVYVCSCIFMYMFMYMYGSCISMFLYVYVHVYVCCAAGVGGIEAEAVMLGQCISMVLPEVIGYKITGSMNQLTTSTDIVLTITKVDNALLV